MPEWNATPAAKARQPLPGRPRPTAGRYPRGDEEVLERVVGGMIGTGLMGLVITA